MTGFDSKRKIALDRLDDDDVQVYAKPVQEPVAWAVYDKRGGSKSLHWSENHSPNGDATMFDAVPLVPQRPWVGLTKENTFDIAIQIGIDVTSDNEDSIYIFCKAIQAALKEKNFD